MVAGPRVLSNQTATIGRELRSQYGRLRASTLLGDTKMRKLLMLVMLSLMSFGIASADDWHRHSDLPRHSVHGYYRRPYYRVRPGYAVYPGYAPGYAYPRRSAYIVVPRHSRHYNYRHGYYGNRY